MSVTSAAAASIGDNEQQASEQTSLIVGDKICAQDSSQDDDDNNKRKSDVASQVDARECQQQVEAACRQQARAGVAGAAGARRDEPDQASLLFAHSAREEDCKTSIKMFQESQLDALMLANGQQPASDLLEFLQLLELRRHELRLIDRQLFELTAECRSRLSSSSSSSSTPIDLTGAGKRSLPHAAHIKKLRLLGGALPEEAQPEVAQPAPASYQEADDERPELRKFHSIGTVEICREQFARQQQLFSSALAQLAPRNDQAVAQSQSHLIHQQQQLYLTQSASMTGQQEVLINQHLPYFSSSSSEQLAERVGVACNNSHEIVQRSFSQLSSAAKEMARKMAFKCHVCQSCFEDRHRLQQHLSIHLNLHPSWFEERTIKETMAQYELRRGDYLCHVCQVRYETTSEFDKHMHLHGDKPHQCHLCVRENKFVSFRYFRQLLTHLRSHCFLYSCKFAPECSQTANRKDYLKLHILKHHLNNKLPEQFTICCH